MARAYPILPRARQSTVLRSSALTSHAPAANVGTVATRVLVALLVLAGIAEAGPTIVLVETRDAPALPTLATQVEMYASQRASVHALAAPDADPMTFAERASALVAAGDATIVVWIAPVDRGFLVYVAGARPGRALVEHVLVDASLGPAEIERTVALKIAGILDAVLAPGATTRSMLEIDVEPEHEWRVEIDGGVSRDWHERGFDGFAAFGVSHAWRRDRWTFAPLVAGYWQPSGVIVGASGQASVTDLGVALALEGGADVGPVQLFVRPRATASALFARGASNDGRSGKATVFAPYAGVEAGVRRPVSETLQVGLVMGADFALIRHEFLIDQETIVDLGRVRLHVGLSLTISL